jgi:outer membrane protein assembly factor BamD (BamD/ComL family)
MKTLLGFSLLAAALLHADTPAADPANDPARQLYDTGIRQTAAGKLADARTTLRTLVDEYPKNPLALQAKGAIDATLLFEEGQARVKSGKCETARVAFETLIAVYPENPLAARAKLAIDAIGEKEKSSRLVLKSMEFRDVAAVPVDEIRAAMDAREIRLNVGQPCRSKDVQQAKAAIEEILVEKGVTHARVEVRMQSVAPDSVTVIFSVEKSHGSLLGSPWRLAMAGWHRVHPVAETPSEGL